MKFISTKGLSNNSYTREVLKIVVENPRLFIPLSRVFSDFNKIPEEIQEVEQYIEDVFNSPKFKVANNGNIKLLLQNIYKLNIDKFNDVRAKILESIIYSLGPLSLPLERGEVFIEPVIEDHNGIIGESEIKCDCVFYTKDDDPLEFIECKSNIRSIISVNKDFLDVKKSIQRKIIYLENAYQYLSVNYCRPYIYFACYNANVDSQEKSLREYWGYKYMSILNPDKVIEMYTDKQV